MTTRRCLITEEIRCSCFEDNQCCSHWLISLYSCRPCLLQELFPSGYIHSFTSAHVMSISHSLVLIAHEQPSIVRYRCSNTLFIRKLDFPHSGPATIFLADMIASLILRESYFCKRSLLFLLRSRTRTRLFSTRYLWMRIARLVPPVMIEPGSFSDGTGSESGPEAALWKGFENRIRSGCVSIRPPRWIRASR